MNLTVAVKVQTGKIRSSLYFGLLDFVFQFHLPNLHRCYWHLCSVLDSEHLHSSLQGRTSANHCALSHFVVMIVVNCLGYALQRAKSYRLNWQCIGVEEAARRGIRFLFH